MAAAPLVTKNDFRRKVWTHLEKNDLAEFPRPVHNRIPNFKGAPAAAHSLAALSEFKEAKVLKVNPDKPQETVRYLALEVEKTVLVPTPRLRHGLFNRLQPPSLSKEDLHRVARAEGVRKFSTPVGLDNIVPVDLIVVGSVAVSKDGYRIGKGEGYADLEYAVARGAGAVQEDTLVITTVHDDQVFDFLPPELFGVHDLTVDVIVTPTQVIRVSKRHPKPTGIIWKLVTPRKLKAIPVLKALREKEAAAGKDVTLGAPTEEERAETAAARRGPRRRERGAGDAGYSDADDEEKPRRRPAGGGQRRELRRRRRRVSDAAASDAQEEPEEEEAGARRRRRVPPAEEDGRRAARPRRDRDRPPIDHTDGLTVIVRRIPADARPRDLREAILAADSPATILSWKGRQGIALLRLRAQEAVTQLLEAGDQFQLVGETVTLERYERFKPLKPERPEKSERPPRREARRQRPEKERSDAEERSESGGRRPGARRAVSAEEADLTVFIGRLPATTRVRELREALHAAGALEPSIAWKGRRGMAFVRMKTPEAAQELVDNADKLRTISDDLVVERYKGKEEVSEERENRREKGEKREKPEEKRREKTSAAARSASAAAAAASSKARQEGDVKPAAAEDAAAAAEPAKKETAAAADPGKEEDKVNAADRGKTEEKTNASGAKEETKANASAEVIEGAKTTEVKEVNDKAADDASESSVVAANTDAKPTEKSDVKPAEKSGVKPAEKSDAKPTEKSDVKPAEKSDAKPVEKSDFKPAEKSDVKPTEKSDVKPAEKSDAKPAEKLDVKPAEKSDVKPAEKSDVKPAERSDAKPAEKSDVKPVAAEATNATAPAACTVQAAAPAAAEAGADPSAASEPAQVPEGGDSAQPVETKPATEASQVSAPAEKTSEGK